MKASSQGRKDRAALVRRICRYGAALIFFLLFYGIAIDLVDPHPRPSIQMENIHRARSVVNGLFLEMNETGEFPTGFFEGELSPDISMDPNDRFWRHPERGEPLPWLLNDRLPEGVPFSDTPLPEIPLLAQPVPCGKKRIVAFGDGSVRTIPEAEFTWPPDSSPSRRSVPPEI